MICLKCGAEVPEGKLACDCFQVDADQEREARAVLDYLEGTGRGLRSIGENPKHIVIAENYLLTLCRAKRLRYSRNLETLGRHVFTGERKPISFCTWCWSRAKELVEKYSVPESV